ncbi:MAG: MlaD family protein, partial [Candidatus Binatia bacterium]
MKFDSELWFGLLLLCGMGILGYLSLNRGQISFGNETGYTLEAEFTSAGGLQSGAVVELAGVEIGRVTSVTLTPDYRAHVTLRLLPTVRLHEDARAVIKSVGLIGERYVEILPGQATTQLPPGDHIRYTETP